MRFLLVLLASSFLFIPSILAEQGSIRGTLSKVGDQILLKSQDKSRVIDISKEFAFTLDSKVLNSPNYIFEFVGDITDSKVVTKQSPTIVAGDDELVGTLEKKEDGSLYIGDQKVKFGRTKEIYKISFDQKSKDSFVGKNIIAQGNYLDDAFEMNAIVLDDLISANTQVQFQVPQGFESDPEEFIIEEMAKNIHSQSMVPFRAPVYDSKKKVYPGESVLVITLSGRQGDSPGAAGGHFTVGMGTVQEDMSIKGEVSNFYFEGPKEVLAGNTDLVSYFGHFIQGQQNYRPTFTLFIYGVDKNKLKYVRDYLEVENHKVRTEKGLEITPGYNCTTTSNDALREVGIKGSHRNFLRTVFDVQNLSLINPLRYGSRNAGTEGTLDTLRTISYALSEDPEHYVPRAAFNSYVKNFSSKRKNKKLGVKRVDYLFMPQTPSARQIGGMSYDQPIKEGKKVIDYDKKREARIARENTAKEILESRNSTEEQREWAREVLRNEVSFAEDMRLVKEFLNNTID
ncbi:hypothetical protein [Halobacteriovorax sp. JY17]|uniref:hypothetical protein n=1 Tax=Halobacteriovorax sp. JY17 TaxID=2014617 RepID=UPI000C35DEC0|nr:hypothetical protein [Halobacteriovorax sp. JY17]PIK15232.1 MAG: hypothetical protein CES88_00545 [Halobacteriovorax sp. JY17]